MRSPRRPNPRRPAATMRSPSQRRRMAGSRRACCFRTMDRARASSSPSGSRRRRSMVGSFTPDSSGRRTSPRAPPGFSSRRTTSWLASIPKSRGSCARHGTWPLNDEADGGSPYSDPAAVVVGTGAKAYVLRYTRNEIAVLDTSNPANGGVPTGFIDLSAQVQPDGDGFVEMSAGVYVPSKGLVYVLLANINSGNVGCDGYCLICSDTHPTVVAIDVATDKLVDLNGSAAGVALSLQGYQPILGQGTMAYDAESDRLLVLESGCNVARRRRGSAPVPPDRATLAFHRRGHYPARPRHVRVPSSSSTSTPIRPSSSSTRRTRGIPPRACSAPPS